MTDPKIGDVVQLNSSGPKMTIEEIKGGAHGLLCVWFDGSEKKAATFVAETLKKV